MQHPNLPNELTVLYEDNHCLAVYKPGGVLTAGDKTGDRSVLDKARQYIKEKYHKPGNVYLGVVHRLDRPVSGVVLLARTSKAAARLTEQFRTRTVTKVYWAVVEGAPPQPSAELVDYLVKDKVKNIVTRVDRATPGAQQASLGYRVVRQTGRYSVLEITLMTGRSHQIRVQLAGRGSPVAGDVKYGAQRLWAGRIALHAYSLEFIHPVRGTSVRVEAPPPADWDRFDDVSSAK